jgi:hypothetical protein
MSHTCLEYTKSKDKIDGYMLNKFTTTTTKPVPVVAEITTTTSTAMSPEEDTTEAPEQEGDEAPEQDTTEAPEEDTTEAPESSTGDEAPEQEEEEKEEQEDTPVGSNDGVKEDAPVASIDGSAASLDAAGFKEVTSLCCPPEMEVFFTRLLTSSGYSVCSTPHIQGLMHWFSCVPDMDFAYMLQVIEQGNPCKYWTKVGEACPELSAKCAGSYCR